MRKQNSPLQSMATALLVAAGLCFTSTANAQLNPADTDATYDGFLRAYLVTVDSTHAYFVTSIATRTEEYQWHQAYLIAGAEDAYDRTKDPTRQALITSLLNQYILKEFTDHSSTDLSWDTYNDDVAWGDIALSRAYLITGNTSYLTYSENVFNLAYSRGYPTANGGGILEKSRVTIYLTDRKRETSLRSWKPRRHLSKPLSSSQSMRTAASL